MRYKVLGVLVLLGGIGLLVFSLLYTHHRDAVTEGAFAGAALCVGLGMLIFAKPSRA